MENLIDNLKIADSKKSSDEIWASFSDAVCILDMFREKVKNGSLQIEWETQPCYIFNPYDIHPCVESDLNKCWEKYSRWVIEIIRESSGMRVEWSPGNPIKLYIPDNNNHMCHQRNRPPPKNKKNQD